MTHVFNPFIEDADTGKTLGMCEPMDNTSIISTTSESSIKVANEYGGKLFFYNENGTDAAKGYAYILSLKNVQIPINTIQLLNEKIILFFIKSLPSYLRRLVFHNQKWKSIFLIPISLNTLIREKGKNFLRTLWE